MPQWQLEGRRAESNNGWEGYGPWPYTILEEGELARHLERLSGVRKEGMAECLSFQPYPQPGKNQDRLLISHWDTPHGTWKLFCVFDGTHTSLALSKRLDLTYAHYQGTLGMRQ